MFELTIDVTSCINIEKSSFFLSVFCFFFGGWGWGGHAYLLYIFLIELPDL